MKAALSFLSNLPAFVYKTLKAMSISLHCLHFRCFNKGRVTKGHAMNCGFPQCVIRLKIVDCGLIPTPKKAYEFNLT